MLGRLRQFFTCFAALAPWAGADAADDFKKDILPLLEQYCTGCHDEAAKGGVNLEALTTDQTFWREPKVWEKALSQLRDQGMPPLKKTQPKPEERARLVQWLQATLDAPDATKVPRSAGKKPIHRLSRLEYNNTVRDLLGVDLRPADNFPPDGGGGGGFDNNASTLFVPPILMERYLAAANDLVAAAKPERLFRVRPGAGKDDRTAARESLEFLGARAFRRAMQAEELAGILALYDGARQRGEKWEDAVRLGVTGLLVSPSFLFRIEQDKLGPGPQRVSDFELACRLSYFLWSSMPDDTLLGLAIAGKLDEPAVLEAQVRRMLADPRARALSENFSTQWLRTKELNTSVRPAANMFPQFTPKLREAMSAEPVEFFHGLIRENRPIVECLDADYTYANDVLAKFYGLPEVKGEALQRVALTDRARGGVVTMAGVLTLTSYPRRTSPVLRGKWVMEEILGTPPPPPPANIKTLGNSDKPKNGLTFRQQLEEHRKNPECAGCHKAMDQLGFGLEGFSPVGAIRTTVSDKPVDAVGQLPDGGKFNGAAEMKKLLFTRKDEFVRTVTEKMLSYSLGRGLDNGDWITVRQISKAVAQDGYKSQRLVLEIVKSFPFQYREPAATTASQP